MRDLEHLEWSYVKSVKGDEAQKASLKQILKS